MEKFSETKIVLIVLLAALAVNAVVLVFRFPLARMLYEITVENDETKIYLTKGIDGLLDRICPDGNLFIRFEGFEDREKKNVSGYDVASIIYFRAVYHLYPRKVLAGPENQKIVRGTEFLTASFNPGGEWLVKNGIGSVLTLSRNERGEISWRCETVQYLREKD